MRLADIVSQYAPMLLERYGNELLPGQLKALNAFQHCRSADAPRMLLSCEGCEQQYWLPHSCGNRHCPHCQAYESQRWIDRQLQGLVPGDYFMLTFTLPAQFRSLAWRHQRQVYELISKLVKLVQLIKRVVVPPPHPRPAVNCACCGKPMRIVRTRVKCAGEISLGLDPVRETAV